MIKEKWGKFISNNYIYKKNTFEYRRVFLLNSILFTMVVVFFIFVILNFILLSYVKALVNLIGFISSLIILYFFHKTNNIKLVAIITVFILMLALIALFHIVQHESYIFIWMIVIPPIAYFLLGRKIGFNLSFAFFFYVLIFISLNYSKWGKVTFTISSLVNIIFAFISLVIIISFFEFSRQEAFKAIEEKNRQLSRLTNIDKLTGLYNRSKIDELLNYQIVKMDRSQYPFSIIFCDIDNFKNINDNYGHIIGDEILKEIAEVLNMTCRKIDFIGRWGGEEFLIICPETNLEGALNLAKRICNKIKSHSFEKVEIVTMSFGVTNYQRGDEINSMLKRADKALYHAKATGKDRVCTHINYNSSINISD